ncbi:MAG: transposase [Bdellovibrionota bacterium]
MTRQLREVYPLVPHHIVQRGCRRERTFFDESDFRTYIRYLDTAARKYNVEIWCYCLMDNHIHLIACPHDKTGLSKMIGHAHRKYSYYINKKMGWTGHLWQYRFESDPLEENEVLTTARYIERNPVVAKMVSHPCDYPWSSAHVHTTQKPDDLVRSPHLYKLVDDWKIFIEQPTVKEMVHALELEEKMLASGKTLSI